MKKILMFIFSVCASVPLAACNGDYTSYDKEVNEYYKYLESSVEATSQSMRGFGDSFGSENVNTVIGEYNQHLYESFDYMSLDFYRREGVIFNSITFTVSSKKDVTLWSVGTQGKGYLNGKYSNAYSNIFDVNLNANEPQTFTLYMDECALYNGSSENNLSMDYIPSNTSRDNRMFSLFFNVYVPSSGIKFFDRTSEISSYDFGIRFSDISFDFELEG